MAKLIFRYSAMNSGKTTNLLQVAHNYEERGFKVQIGKPIIDTKGAGCVQSRIGLERPVDFFIYPSDNEVWIDDLETTHVVLIDEAQFLTKQQVNHLYSLSKTFNVLFICYGLRCDFRMQGFPGASRLLEIADEIEELKTICSCGRKATQNLRLINGQPTFKGKQISIDNQEDVKYESLCGDCYTKILLENIEK